MRRTRTISALFGVVLALAATAPAGAAVPSTCGLAEPDLQMTGEFGTEHQGSYVLLPFDVPTGQTAVRIRYCYDQPEIPNPQFRNTLDLDVYEARDPQTLWGVNEFRGSSGSARREGNSAGAQVTLSEDGFDATTGRTTRSMRPGPIEPGEWAVQLPVAAVVTPEQGNTDGKVAYRVQIDLISDPAFADEDYEPAPYDPGPANTAPGWYAGDLHIHANHSEGGATMKEAFDFAFEPLAKGGAGLDFVSLTDHNTDSAFGEIGLFQPEHPGKLVIRGTEVTTFRGHMMNHATGTYLDHRTGPVLEASFTNGVMTGLVQRRAPRPAREVLRAVKAAGGFNQVNHPTIFPSEVPLFANLCRGCSWSYSDEETDYSSVDAIEVATGPAGLDLEPLDPGPNPFSATGIQFWEDKLAKGHKIAAIGVSDSHEAGEAPSPTTAPIGQGTTVVFADELSEDGVQRAIEAGHTYVKLFGNDRPDLRFEATAEGVPGPPAIMGDTLKSTQAGFVARVLGAAPAPDRQFQLLVIKDGLPILTVPVTSGDFSLPFPSIGTGRYRLQLQRGTAIEAVSSPIYLEAPSPGGGGGAPPGGSPGGGGTSGQTGGAGAACRDRVQPGAYFARPSRLRVSRRGVFLRGRAFDRGCGRAARPARVLISVRSARGGRCRYLDSRGKLRRRSCARPIRIRARGTSTWSLRVRGRLPAGRYRAFVTPVDRAGNRRRAASVAFRVR